MEVYPLIQARLFLCCVCLGALTALAFDTLGVFLGEGRGILRSLARGMGDVLVFSAFAGAVAVLSFYFNSGQIRFFSLLGAALGAAAYKCLLSRAVRAAEGRCRRAFSRLFSGVGRFLGGILKKYVNFLKKYYFILLKHLKK